jgi:hypothetical protein
MVKSQLASWIQRYAIWIAILFLFAATFIASNANRTVLPLVFICVAIVLIFFRYWDLINAFALSDFSKWARTRIGSIGIRHWHTPYHAATRFCDPTVVKTRNDAAAKMNSIMMELVKGGRDAAAAETKIPEQETTRPITSEVTESYSAYERASAVHEQCNILLARDLLKQLIAGDLIAKGSSAQNEITQSECIIPKSHWTNMSFDIATSEASGSGLHYVRIVIGKRSKMLWAITDGTDFR